MAIASFIPQIWGARLQQNLRRSLIFGALVNHYYEGEIRKYGDTVHINTLNDITVKPYTKGIDIDAPEQLTGTDSVLKINHGAYFNFYVDDVDQVQSRHELVDTATENAAYQLADDAEQYIISIIRQEAGIKPTLSMPSKENGGLYSLLVEMKATLDGHNVPRNGRKLVITPKLEGALLMDTDHFIGLGSDASEARMANGRIGRILGMDVHVSNSLVDEFAIFVPEAITFANQITEIEAYRPERAFADGVKGLMLSGAKVTRPKAVCLGTIIEE